jgi:hypothetical protein
MQDPPDNRGREVHTASRHSAACQWSQFSVYERPSSIPHPLFLAAVIQYG